MFSFLSCFFCFWGGSSVPNLMSRGLGLFYEFARICGFADVCFALNTVFKHLLGAFEGCFVLKNNFFKEKMQKKSDLYLVIVIFVIFVHR